MITSPTYVFQEHDLGDQDAINTIAITLPELIYILPCSWNYQTTQDAHVVKFIDQAKMTQTSFSFQPCKFRPFLWHFNGFEIDVFKHVNGVINIVNSSGLFKIVVQEAVSNNKQDIQFEGHMTYNCSVRCGVSLSGLALMNTLIETQSAHLT